ncbi:alpha/beta hydrolase [Rhizobium laguerreae]|uniref:Alpha/beta hydrolase n=1 Tax=Rhizobium laguerreae TaxID=1076926 RepID=A0AB35F9D7_9HYPH|nr:alpha/beta hydrolase [Rhizobium laguerreae]MBY3063191.1 alpha/beta hydrolase [Rhizobium laguerreae]MBY3076011.1 alpha/beta hydrolase [Rhizobium laguerreae]MBY3112251.1 alpha/beta hydrolase [Rhizobium laguerreae]MBY3201036.1 alpha/beta hydrolase [Rhizobium laguerreae]MBY3244519.1 alpha/beta hydrolase [Rhizobium laguerreae]
MKSVLMSALMLTTAMLGAAPAWAQPALPDQTIKNIVLVHGAFVDETSWDGVAAILTAKGYKVTAVKNPLTSLADDVAATNAVLDAQNGPVVLVGHSWGGVVIGEAGDNAKVASLVYVSAFAPKKGETITALAASGPATPGAAAIRPDAKGYLTIDPAVFPSAVAGDLPKKIGEHLAAHQMPINHTAFDAPAEVAAWHDKPSWYVLSSKDLVLDPHAQAFFAERMKAKVTTVEGSHASLASHAEEVAAVIEAAAGAK